MNHDTPEVDTGIEGQGGYDRRDAPSLKPNAQLLLWFGYIVIALFGVALLAAIWMPEDEPERRADRDRAPLIDTNVPALTMPVFKKEPAPPPFELIQSAEAAEPPALPITIPPPASQNLGTAGGTGSGEAEDPMTRRLNSPVIAHRGVD